MLWEIQKLRNSGDPIHLEINPLPVAMDLPMFTGKEFGTGSIDAHSSSDVTVSVLCEMGLENLHLILCFVGLERR